MSTSPHANRNVFLTGSLGTLFARTAIPIIFVMGMSGLQTVIDAYFLGTFVGADALTAVTLMFPVFMLLVAMSTLVAGGMASVLARYLGAGNHSAAIETFVSAHALALMVCLLLIALFAAAGYPLVEAIAGGSEPLARMGYEYIAILIYASPIMFFLSVNGDALRCEGKVGLMAAISLATSIANIVFNYVLIVMLQQGVAGSAVGTVLAQLITLSVVVVYRTVGHTPIRLRHLSLAGWNRRWGEFLALGAPQSLNFLGVSLGSAATIVALQIWSSEAYEPTVAAYGVITRIMTFIFLPLLGLNMAMQTVTGNNFGAQLWHRSDASLRLGALIGLVYCGLVQLVLIAFSPTIGQMFVDDVPTVDQVARILPVIMAVFFAAGPIVILSGYYQAIGDARRAAVISLTRTYLFAIPLTFILPFAFGEWGIWFAGPAAEVLVVGVALMVLVHARSTQNLRYGLFRQAE